MRLSWVMVEQINEMHQKIEQLKTEIPKEDNYAGEFETQLEKIINMESFDREKIQQVIKKSDYQWKGQYRDCMEHR